MADVIVQGPCTLLDVGCGTSRFLDFLKAEGLDEGVTYAGLDANPEMIEKAVVKHPEAIYRQNDLMELTIAPQFTYVVMCGVLTYRGDASLEDQWFRAEELVKRAFLLTGKTLAFNVYSPLADHEDPTLWYPPFEQMVEFVSSLSSRFTIRHDYGLHEYTVYVHRDEDSEQDRVPLEEATCEECGDYLSAGYCESCTAQGK